MGLSPVLAETIFRTILEINREGTTDLLVEQNAAMALQVAQRGYVLESGTIALHASAAELRETDTVRRTYLGLD
jgi:branched-chain amino acid transport system ATP-binding protein